MHGYLDIFKRQVVLMHVSGVRADGRWFLVVGLMSVVTAVSINSLMDDSTISTEAILADRG